MPDPRRAILAVLFCVVVAVQVRWSASTIERLLQPPHNPELVTAVNSSLVLQGDEGKKLLGVAQPKDRTEARDGAGDEYGEARLAELSTGFGDLASHSALAALIADVDRFAGDTPQHDDLTALVLRAV